MNRYQLNKDGEEVLKQLNDPKVQGTKFAVIFTILWHILCWIERRTK